MIWQQYRRQCDVLVLTWPWPDLDQTRIGGCSLGSLQWGVRSLTAKTQVKEWERKRVKERENADPWPDLDHTRIGGCSLGSLRWGVGRLTTKKEWERKRVKEWENAVLVADLTLDGTWIRQWLVAVPWVHFGEGSVELQQKKEWERKIVKEWDNADPWQDLDQTRIGGCSLGSLRWGVGWLTTKKSEREKE